MVTGICRRKSVSLHPAEQFAAPGSIEKGTPLKFLIGENTINLWSESFAAVLPGFNGTLFRRQALDGLEQLELTQRAAHVADTLLEQLPEDFDEISRILIDSMGPELKQTSGNGLAPFFYLLHSHVIAAKGTSRFESGMRACYELTKRFTAEFCLRAFVVEHQSETLGLLKQWVTDPNPHIRRLVSEGTRPRLPWGIRLRAVQQNPQLTIPLLEQLKDDPELYVRRSVANHLGDLLKDSPQLVYEICRTWIREVKNKPVPLDTRRARHWMIRHAVRLPAKKGDPVALQLRSMASGK